MRASATERPRRQRVRALPPEDRRAALIEATIPLLREHGLAVSTRQIADAAGVAEGTIFGVFPDKLSLIHAALAAAFDSEPVVLALSKIKRPAATDRQRRDLHLRRRLGAAVRLIEARIAHNAPLLAVARGSLSPTELLAARERIVDALAALIEPDQELLRRSPVASARLLLSMIFAHVHGVFGHIEVADGAELVSLLLDGLLVRAQPHPARPHPTLSPPDPPPDRPAPSSPAAHPSPAPVGEPSC